MLRRPASARGIPLVCPHCRETCTHVNQVFITARHEDDRVNEIAVDAVTGATIVEWADDVIGDAHAEVPGLT